ncbi:MAG: o-succinylbenzoate synthase, partial [Cyanobacteriota bacterium]|nr:o-succinylbenzoate synthase [Cyanobacteriota bacterium]
CYQRRFRQPLQTHRGIWKVREGIILRLKDENGTEGWGEIAPLPDFGSETLSEALDCCQQLGRDLTKEAIASIPGNRPACQFGFESAATEISARTADKPSNDTGPKHLLQQFTYSYLLPAGEGVLRAWKPAWEKGGRTFKWKIGVRPVPEELQLFSQLVRALPAGAKLRLDANGGLNFNSAQQWLKAADEVGMVEFIEQPLPPTEFALLLELRDRAVTPLALDESVATLPQLEDCYARGWRGIFAIKAAIAGSPQRLREFCRNHPIDAVFSSVFETSVGRKAVLNLATELSNPNRALGFGVDRWFEY